MFKYILFRALETTTSVFARLDSPTVGVRREVMLEYNRRAEPVWKSEGQSFVERQRECDKIQEELFSGFPNLSTFDDLEPVPESMARKVDRLFREHYRTKDVLILGRTDDEALGVQEKYALAVAKVLGGFDSRYEARAYIHLGKMYGRGAPLPILGCDSASAIWRACNSYYYHAQIAMVSTAVEPFSSSLTLGTASDLV